MDFPHAEPLQRLRYPSIPDPYFPENSVIDLDGVPVTVMIAGFVSSSSSYPVTDATRSQIVTSKSLYLTDPDADVRVDDRIVSGPHTYRVDAVPEADRNPFTGWRPVVEIPIEEVLG